MAPLLLHEPEATPVEEKPSPTPAAAAAAPAAAPPRVADDVAQLAPLSHRPGFAGPLVLAPPILPGPLGSEAEAAAPPPILPPAVPAAVAPLLVPHAAAAPARPPGGPALHDAPARSARGQPVMSSHAPADVVFVTKRACRGCQKAKAACSPHQRPCARCVKLNIVCESDLPPVKTACTECRRAKVKCLFGGAVQDSSSSSSGARESSAPHPTRQFFRHDPPLQPFSRGAARGCLPVPPPHREV